MLDNLIYKKVDAEELTLADYYEAVDYLLKNGVDAWSRKFFYSLNSFGMSKKEVLYLTMAMRDSGKVLKFNHCIMEKHSTGGVGDSTSVVLIPLLASLGFKVIKTTAKSFVFTNGSADRFGAIPRFKAKLSDDEIKIALETANACVLSHDGDMCPADKLLHDFRAECGLETDINLMAASIAAKKLASGAKVVLVDVKYGEASLIKDYSKALKLANLLKYIFDECEVESTIVLTDTVQTFGDGVGNAIEVVDALDVLRGKQNFLREMSVFFATEMILKAKPNLKREDVEDMVKMALDNGTAYEAFLKLVKAQGGSVKAVKEDKIFKPYKTINFVSDKEGYVGDIHPLLLGELVRRMCQETHDSNLGISIRVKIGDYIKKGDVIVTFYYKTDEELAKYKNAISKCIGVTDYVVKPVDIIRKVIR